jgi:hypothetical protein
VKPKKKPGYHVGARIRARKEAEARASSALDGECKTCGHPLAGECPDSPLTKAVVEAAMNYTDTNRHDVAWRTVLDACNALRAEMGGR